MGALRQDRARRRARARGHDWIHENVEYGVASLPTTATVEIFERRGGMCRDFAHLGVTFCRALGIPARYSFGYMPDIGVPGPYPDDGLPRLVRGLARRTLVDARRPLQHAADRPRADRPGRDAADVAMVTTYGDATLTEMTVWADESAEAALPRGREALG